MQEKNALRLISKYRKAIMGFAALWIFIFHSWNPTMEGHWRIYAVEKFIKEIGFCGVEFFLFLSGMGLIFAIKKYNVAIFYKRRVIRVFLPLLITTIVTAVLQGWEWDVFLKTLFGINFYLKTVFTFLWFGTAIMTIYLLFPLYYHFFRRATNKYEFTLLVIVLWLFLSVLLDGVMRSDLFGVTNRIPVFVLGVLAGWMVQEREVVFTKDTWSLCILMLVAGLYLIYVTTYEGYQLLLPVSNCCLPPLLIAISGSCILAKFFAIIDGYWKVLGKAVLRIFDFFGEISFEFYCVQETVCEMIVPKLSDAYNNVFINLISFLCSLAAALALCGVCRLIRMFHKGKKTGDAAK